MVTITTTYTTNDKGHGKIVAKGCGKQRTITYDHAMSHDANHGTAAGTLALVLDLPWTADIVHVSGNGRHEFMFPTD